MFKARLARRVRPKAADFLDLPAPSSAVHITRKRPENPCEENEDDTSVDSDEGTVDIDVPRVAQWIDDDDFELNAPEDEGASSAEADSDSSADEHASDPRPRRPSRTLEALEDDLSTLPLGTLRTAQRSLAQAHALDSDSASGSESPRDPSDIDNDIDTDGNASDVNAPAKDARTKRPTKLKRAHKHAPVETTSKRPVSRRRTVVDDTLPKPRDPRFMHAAGRYDPSTFSQHYAFLPTLRTTELATLREHLARARRLLATSPSHLRQDREQEVERLARALKRAESAVNRDTREHAERAALGAATRAEKEKRKQGKAEWWMKRSEKKTLLAKARMDAIASAGGKRAVRKALEKKQKKISQKEKRTRPFPRNDEGTDGKKRRPVGSLDMNRGPKRRKMV